MPVDHHHITNVEEQLDAPRFREAWHGIGARDEGAFAVLVACYAQTHRAYHVAEHINECLGWLDHACDLAERPAELTVALYFHDAVYDPMARDNEARSAELLRKLGGGAGIPEPALARIGTLIEATARHSATNGDAALLCDIDLTILGAPPSRYARFEREVRREYGAFDDAVYRAGRARVLRNFLERMRIYQTDRIAARLEAQARDNLGRALAALEAT